jgi:flagellar protein FliS
MWTDAYLESQVLTADPLELVRMLYRGALDSIREARALLAAGEIAARCNAISRVQAILAELNASLDHHKGGEISRNLAALYAYVRSRLIEGNLQQKDGPLAEAEELLTTLYSAWERAAEPVSAAPPMVDFQPWGAMPAAETHTWSA